MAREFGVTAAAVLLCASLFASRGAAQTVIIRSGPAGSTFEPGTISVSPPGTSTTSQTGTAAVRGRVVDVESGAGLKNVAVRLYGGGLRDTRTAGTDDRGFFQIDELPPGRFTLSASKPGYVTLSYGQRRPFEAGTTLDVADTQTLENVNFALPRGGVIAVRVVDEFGDPISGIRVAAQRYAYFQGQRGLSSVGNVANPFNAGTDDLGETRIYGLPPGDYYVTATSAGTLSPFSTLGNASKGRSYVKTFYPGTSSIADAQRVAVTLGREMAVSFQLSTSRLARIAGTVRASDGSVARNPNVSLTYSVPGGGGSRNMFAQPDGSFSLADVPPGDYAIQVTPPRTGPFQEFAIVPIAVTGDDMLGVSITTTRPGSMRGRLVFDTPLPNGIKPSAVQPSLSTIDSTFTVVSGGQTRVNDDGTFEVTGVMDNRVVRLRTPASGWYVKAVMFEGRDIIDTPIDFSSGRDVAGVEVIVTQKQTKLTGTATDADGKPLTTYAVVVFSAASERWTPQSRFIATGRPDQQGRFEVTGLPPGAYLAVALDYLETGTERDPDLLRRLKDVATPLSLDEGESKAVQLRIASQ